MQTQWVEKTLKNMSLEEKVGQILMVAFFGLDKNTLKEVAKSIQKYHLGGHFQCGNDIKPMIYCNDILQKEAKIPLLIGGDLEAGLGHRIAGGHVFPQQMCRAAGGNEKTEYEVGKITALQGRACGINITASPVLDVNTNKWCPDVNIRAYSDDVNMVCRLSRAYIKGLQENGMLAMAKHFPGNGSTDMDQHITPAILPVSKKQMYDIYLKPYKEAIKKANLASVMVSHLEVPSIVKEKHPESKRSVPASVSKELITGILKKEFGFQGFAVTDALNMGGVNNQYTRSEATIKAIQAGVDMLLVFSPRDFHKNEYRVLLDAVKKKKISEKRLNDAVRNVLKAKARLGLEKDASLPPLLERKKLFAPGKYNPLSKKITDNAVTVLDNRKNILPLKKIKGKKILVMNSFSPDPYIMKQRGAYPLTEIVSRKLKNQGAQVKTYKIHAFISNEEMTRVHKQIEKAEIIFINFFHMPSYGIGTMIPNINILSFFYGGILSQKKPIIITSFGDPFVKYFFTNAPVYMSVYDNSIIAQESVFNAWLGKIPVKGKSPVSLEYIFKKGDGIKIP